MVVLHEKSIYFLINNEIKTLNKYDKFLKSNELINVITNFFIIFGLEFESKLSGNSCVRAEPLGHSESRVQHGTWEAEWPAFPVTREKGHKDRYFCYYTTAIRFHLTE